MKRNLSTYGKNFQRDPYERLIEQYRKLNIRSTLHQKSPTNILEIGCGLKPLFTEYPNYQWTVVEANPLFAKSATHLASKINNARVKVIEGLYEDQQLDCQSFDLIICDCLLHEIPNQGAFLVHVQKHLTPDGVFHVSVPNARSFHRQLAKDMELIQSVTEHSERQKLMQQHNDFFTIESLVAILEKHGFVMVESGGYQFKFGTHAQMTELIRSQIFPENLLDGLMNFGQRYPELASEIFVTATRSS